MRGMIALLILVFGPSLANAQSGRTAWFTIANSTNATLTVTVERLGKEISITLAPNTERRIVAPAGYVTFTAIANRSAPVLTYKTGFALSTGGNYALNLTPRDFGATYMADRPSFDNGGTGITTNTSRQQQESRLAPHNKNSWASLGCYNYYMGSVVKTSEYAVPNGRRQQSFIGAFDASRNKYHCEIANTYGDWATQDASLLNKCRKKLGNSANTCKLWKRWREN